MGAIMYPCHTPSYTMLLIASMLSYEDSMYVYKASHPTEQITRFIKQTNGTRGNRRCSSASCYIAWYG